MQKTSIFLLLLILLFLTACEDKSSKKMTTKTLQDTNPTLTDTFTLTSLSGEYYTVTVFNEKVTFKESNKGIILLSFFATWCTPCLREIPYLNDLQDAYKKDLFITGILIHDNIEEKPFKTFVKQHKINYYLSYANQNNHFASLVSKTLKLPDVFSIPLTVMYVEGEYFTHYEGSVPIEMIRYDIEQAQEHLK